uniref:Erythrocyte band 7 integral membrane protein-like isoform X2 n=1 Tax=Geotrypetes seraphini TaxID=260995 RepID=A0A6P8QHW7_GEOSA|nr:erythrocyte band 7 integral membrane protein-like isoform X2 [Geotrypetes seraphini]
MNAVIDPIVISDHAGHENEGTGFWGIILIFFSFIVFLVTFPWSILTSVKIVREHQRAIIFRLGKMTKEGVRGPGIYFILPCIDEFFRIEGRTTKASIRSEVLTKDFLTVGIDAAFCFKIENPVAVVFQVNNLANTLQMLARSTLGRLLGEKNPLRGSNGMGATGTRERRAGR